MKKGRMEEPEEHWASPTRGAWQEAQEAVSGLIP